jgi:hypothetical protein
MHKTFGIAVLAALLATPVVAQAQGLVTGTERGAEAGDRAAGPVGGIVGGAVGGAVGTVNGAVDAATGILGMNDRPRFHDYVRGEHRPSYAYDHDLRVGAVLPERGVTYYAVPPEYRVRPAYRYTVLNDHPVLVDPITRRIVEILD